MKKIRVLHIVKDDKFIDGPLSHFEDDGRFENFVVMIVDSPDYKCKFIKNQEKIKFLYNKRLVKEELQKDDYDAIFFYSLTDYRIFNYIPQKKIVIWWAWGYDIYGYDRFLDISLYKPLTKQYIANKESIYGRIINFFKSNKIYLLLRDGYREKALKRIDYFQPVIHSEYLLMQKIIGFRAQEFYYPNSRNFALQLNVKKNANGSIMIGNSATATNNHLDIWERINNFIPIESEVFIPINYGDMNYAMDIEDVISKSNQNVKFLKSFIPSVDYFRMLDSCSYAIYGVLRQQAMGNIFRCLSKGVKVFFYKESLPYKYFKDLGCDVFAIEEITEDSFRIPLTAEQVLKNQRCLNQECKMVKEISENAILEIQKRLKKV